MMIALLGTMLLASTNVALAQESDSVTVKINPVNDSGASGSATLTAKGDQTVVDLKLSGLSGDHPNHIHVGSCANPVPEPLYPLTNVVLNSSDEQGESTTTVDVPLQELLNGQYLILIHKSVEEIGTYVACGDITSTSADAAEMPSSGSGSVAQDVVVSPLRVALSVLAFIAAVAGILAHFTAVPHGQPAVIRIRRR